MKDTLNVLTNNPEIGIFSSVGSYLVHYTGVFNPVLSFVSLSIGIIIGLVTLYGKIKDLHSKYWV